MWHANNKHGVLLRTYVYILTIMDYFTVWCRYAPVTHSTIVACLGLSICCTWSDLALTWLRAHLHEYSITQKLITLTYTSFSLNNRVSLLACEEWDMQQWIVPLPEKRGDRADWQQYRNINRQLHQQWLANAQNRLDYCHSWRCQKKLWVTQLQCYWEWTSEPIAWQACS